MFSWSARAPEHASEILANFGDISVKYPRRGRGGASTEYPRGIRGGAATRPHGTSEWLVPAQAAALSEVTVRVARDADRAYGARGWDLYVASDAPGVRRWVTEKLQGRARNIRHLNGTIGHNYFQGQGGAASQGGDAHVQALADLILLSEAHVVAYYDSKFPVIAAERTFCPGLRLPVKGYPRHAVPNGLPSKRGRVDAAGRSRRRRGAVAPTPPSGRVDAAERSRRRRGGGRLAGTGTAKRSPGRRRHAPIVGPCDSGCGTQAPRPRDNHQDQGQRRPRQGR